VLLAARLPGCWAVVVLQQRPSYAAAARELKSVLMPAGDAWRAAWAIDPAVPLYGPDGFHPSITGTYLSRDLRATIRRIGACRRSTA
jgi:hypothetical protein